MTLKPRNGLPSLVGRKKEFPNRITLPLSDEMLAAIDIAMSEGETRLDLIRDAIDREVKRRLRHQSTAKDTYTSER